MNEKAKEIAARAGTTVASETVIKNNGKDFSAYYEAEKILKEAGYRVGSMQRSAPIAFASADEVGSVAKWRNIEVQDYYLMDGVILSESFRNGDVTIAYFSETPVEK